MGCLVALLARVALLGVWLTTPLVTRAFQGGWLLPLLGVLFLPITTLVYILVYMAAGGVAGWGWFWVILGFLIDVTVHTSGAYSNRQRVSGWRPSRST
ncbi:MAG TPA: hypothetical protein VFU88_16830 [Ktedonobacterales bacterium]|nr:hypothetical protein [Ktedonobacterales bacterium]